MLMTPELERKIDDLIERVQDDALQQKLQPGFERDFSNSVVDRWKRYRTLSDRQLEVLEDLVERHESARGSRGGYKRRYEGHG